MSHSVPADAPQDVAVTHRTAGAATETVPVTVVVPVRDGADFAEECLDSVLASRPDEVIVVDGGSSDGTLDAARRRGLRVVTHEGSGPASARMAGAALARHDVVVLLDVDVVLPAGALARWYEEFRARDLAGLQADLAPESLGTRYWGRSLAEHQRISRARRWFTLCATMLRRDVLLEHGIDDSFASGEDIEFRHRLQRAGEPVAVSSAVQVRHRFRDGFTDARHQWEDDGAGLALTIRKNGVRDLPLSAIPAVGFVRGLALTVLRRPQMLGYWCCYLWFNYVALVRGLLRTDPHGLTGNSRSLALTRTLPMGLGFVTWAVAARAFPASDVGLAAAAFSAATLVSHLATSGPGNALVLLAPSRPGSARRLTRAASGVVVATSLAAGVLLAVLAGRFAPSLARLVDHPGGWLAFLALVVAISWAYLYDHVAIAVRRSADALRRSVVQAGLLLMVVLVLLPAAPDPAWPVLVGAGAAGGLASVLLGMAQARRRLPVPSTSPADGELRSLLTTGTPNLALTLVQRGPMLVLPFVVTEALSPAANAAWYVAWMLALAIWFVPNSVAWSLQARLAGDPTVHAPTEVRAALRTAVLATVATAAAVALVGPFLLAVMGDDYVTARSALWVLCVAAVPSVAAEIWLSVRRVAGRQGLPILLFGAVGATVVVCSGLVAGGGDPSAGLARVALVWLAGQVLLGVVAAARLRSDARAVRRG